MDWTKATRRVETLVQVLGQPNVRPIRYKPKFPKAVRRRYCGLRPSRVSTHKIIDKMRPQDES